MIKRIDRFLFISALTGLTFTILFLFRASDDNRLMSWEWVFNNVNGGAFFLALLGGSILLIPISKISFSIRNPKLVLFLISFAAVVPLWSEPEIIVDASRYFTHAKHLELYGVGYFVSEWGRGIMAWTDLPLLPFLYGLLFRGFGESRIFIQIFTTLLFSASVVITYLIGKELWDEDTGFWGGSLLLGSPYLLAQTPLMLVDVPTMFFLVLTIFVFIKAVTGKGPVVMALGGLSISLAVLSKYSTWPMLSVLGVIILVCRNRHSSTPWRSCLLRGSITLLIALFITGIVFFLKYDVISDQIRLLASYQKPGLKRWGESFVSTFFFHVHPFITISALISIWAAVRKRDRNFLIISWLILLMIVFQVKRIRYVLPLFPMVALMSSYGLRHILNGEMKRYVALCVLLSSLLMACFAYLPFARKMSMVNLKGAGAFMDTLAETDAEVFVVPPKDPAVNPAVAVPLLDLYTKKRIRYNYVAFLVVAPPDVKESALRFTWEYRNPRYYGEYQNEKGGKSIIAVITGELYESLPDNVANSLMDYHALRQFAVDEGVFQYRTFVTVYRR